MPNVSVESCITKFFEQKKSEDDTPELLSAEYLHLRELAELAAAKRSASVVARAAHQELAQVVAAFSAEVVTT